MLELFTTLVKNWRTALVIVALVVGLIHTYLLQSKLNESVALNTTLTKQVTELQTTNTNMKSTYESRIQTFSKIIDDQNKSIENYKNDVIRIQLALDVSNKKAAQVRKEADAQIQRILSERIGTGEPITCDQAMKYLVDSAQELRWEPIK